MAKLFLVPQQPLEALAPSIDVLQGETAITRRKK